MREIKVWLSDDLLTIDGGTKIVNISYSDYRAERIANRIVKKDYNFRPFRGGGIGYVATQRIK